MWALGPLAPNIRAAQKRAAHNFIRSCILVMILIYFKVLYGISIVNTEQMDDSWDDRQDDSQQMFDNKEKWDTANEC